MQEQLGPETAKAAYETPKVTDYGTLKEQTASGFSGINSDATFLSS